MQCLIANPILKLHVKEIDTSVLTLEQAGFPVKRHGGYAKQLVIQHAVSPSQRLAILLQIILKTLKNNFRFK